MNSTLIQPLAAIGVGIACVTYGMTISSAASAITLTGLQTSGSQMSGLKVTATFATGGSQTLTWAATDSSSGGVSAAAWSLRQSRDTFNSPWTLTNTGPAIQSLLIDAIPGNAVFDIVSTPELTPGSGLGQPFSVQSGLAPTTATYAGAIDGSLGDLFGRLTLNYDNGFTGTMTFLADTDSITINDPAPAKVPTPALLPALAGLGIGIWRKRKQQ